MSHEFESGFVVDTPAWHGLGHVFDGSPTVEEAMSLGGLDWTVEEHDVFSAAPIVEPTQYAEAYNWDLGSPKATTHAPPIVEPTQYAEVPRYKALVRSTDQRVLSVVRRSYKPLQNRDAFNFFTPFLESGSVSLESGGSLKGGEHVWILGKVNIDAADVVPGDPVVPYILLSNAHNGAKAVWVQFSATRVVCWNTLTMAMAAADGGVEKVLKVKHQKNVVASLDAVRDTVDLARRSFSVTVEQYRAMARMGMGDVQLRQYVRDVMHVPEEEERMPRVYEQIQANFEGGRGADSHRGTVWGGFNAVTEWLDHQRGNAPETRLHSTWFGPGAKIRDDAHRAALDLIV